MASVCFYFQVHQPYRIKKYRIFDAGHDHGYFNDKSDRDINNEKILHKVARKSYLPMNALLLELLKEYPEFKCSFSISGVALEQFEEFAPEVIKSFQKLVKTGRVEILDETYHHSLSFLYSRDEFKRQVKLHRDKVKELFGVEPTAFRNTELVYSNEIAQVAEEMGYTSVLAEGADHVLGWRSPNFLYRAPGTKKIKLHLKNFRLSDDIAFRFSSRDWAEWPLTTEKFAGWVNAVNGNGNVINLFMDYETFGEHQWEDTGIFEFMRVLPREILKHPDNDFVTVTEAAERYEPVGEVDVPFYMSWADVERDLSAWLGNALQNEAIGNLYALEGGVYKTEDPELIADWRKLTTSDHFYYMCTKWFADGDVHKYFNPYDTPYEAFIAFNNVLADMRHRLSALEEHAKAKEKGVKKVPIKPKAALLHETVKTPVRMPVPKKPAAVAKKEEKKAPISLAQKLKEMTSRKTPISTKAPVKSVLAKKIPSKLKTRILVKRA